MSSQKNINISKKTYNVTDTTILVVQSRERKKEKEGNKYAKIGEIR